jgi:phage-related protein
MTSTREQDRMVSKPRRPPPVAKPAPKQAPVVEPSPAEASPSSRAVLQLQGMAGNAAVSALMAAGLGQRSVQRLAGRPVPPPPQPPTPPVPSEHPGFRATQSRVSAARRRAAAHPGAKSKAAEASKAAQPPADDKEAQAKSAKAGEMGAAPAGTFDKAAFIAAVSAAIAKQAPKNLDEADKLASSGKSDTIAAEVKGKVTASKEASAKPMEQASAKTPDTSTAKEKPVTPLAGPPPAAAPPAIDAATAMPARAPAAQTELGNAPAETDQKMADAGVSEQQLAKSNEPELTGALAAKKEGEQHSATAPAAFRASEAQKLDAAKKDAQGAGAQTASGLVTARGVALQQVGGGQQQAQSKDEQNRAMVSGKIKSIFDATKTEVDAILKGLDDLVDKQFTDGEAKAKAAFTADHKARMEKYKDERYSGATGWARWTADLFTGLPPEANQIYQLSKKVYETQMTTVISDIADTVGRELTRAKDRIAQGRKEIATYVNGLDPSLKSIGNEAAKQIGSQFDSLEESVNEKSASLAEDLAEKYVTARNAVDDEIKAMQEENKGLWDKAKDAIGGAIETILKLKNMLLGVLARAAGAVEKIIKDPIGFLGNFINAVKTGVLNFGSNILEHLKKGLQSWLFGALAEAGIEIPEKFDLKGIVGLILSLLGLTWASIRARLAKVLPEWVLKALETAVEVVKILTTEGVSGLWTWIVKKLTDLKEQVFSQIKEFVITKIITAGITWLISLLNPAAAFIKACKMIYDAVMWFVDNAERLKDFVDSVLDSVESIASGGVGRVAGLIESTLGKAVPMVISGLASLLGLGGIAEKIKKILETIQKPVGKVVDGIINGVIKYGKKLLGKLKKKKDKEPDTRTPAEKQAAVTTAIKESEAVLDRSDATRKSVEGALPAIKDRHRLTVLQVVDGPEGFRVHAELNPKGDSKAKADSKTWKLAPGGFTAHEGQQFMGPDGPMVNRRGNPIMVHTIVRHVTIPAADVAQRVQRGLGLATGFLNAAAMEQAVNACLENRATEISEAFNAGGKPARTGTSHTTVYRGNKLIGYGYEVFLRQSQANKAERGFRRVAVEVAESALTGVTVHLRVTNSESREFMVETAYPTPK